jgi:YHS domain-containing protein
MFALIERLFLLLFLVSVARSVLRFVFSFWSGFRNSGTPARSGAGPAQRSGGNGTATMLHQDPVCGTYVAADSSLKRLVGGKVIHFCSEDCRNRYHG